MKPCPYCGGTLLRHGTSENRTISVGIRYRCRNCRKSLTVRDGEISTLKGRPFKIDWRHS